MSGGGVPFRCRSGACEAFVKPSIGGKSPEDQHVQYDHVKGNHPKMRICSLSMMTPVSGLSGSMR